MYIKKSSGRLSRQLLWWHPKVLRAKSQVSGRPEEKTTLETSRAKVEEFQLTTKMSETAIYVNILIKFASMSIKRRILEGSGWSSRQKAGIGSPIYTWKWLRMKFSSSIFYSIDCTFPVYPGICDFDFSNFCGDIRILNLLFGDSYSRWLSCMVMVLLAAIRS